MKTFSNENLNFNLLKTVFFCYHKAPLCISSINLGEKDTSYIMDLCVSPSEPDLVALCKSNGVVQLISKYTDKQPKVVMKSLEALCSEYHYFLLFY